MGKIKNILKGTAVTGAVIGAVIGGTYLTIL